MELLLQSAKARCAMAKSKSENINNCLNTLCGTRTYCNISCGAKFIYYIKDSSYLLDPNYSYILYCSKC